MNSLDAASAADLTLELLRALSPTLAAQTGRLSAAEQRQTLADILTVRPPDPIDPGTMARLDALLDYELAQRPLVDSRALAGLADWGTGSRVSLWQGDITTLIVDAIVNAANNQMLGCFAPGHACIDNAIHAAAGPALRTECADHIMTQGHLEPTGTATLTAGYHLPARYVLHTVGPIVRHHIPSDEDASALASCYRACLARAAEQGEVTSVAFCAISTGVFGYPIEAAAQVAVATTLNWLEGNPTMRVVFNTFSDRDTQVYRSTLESFLP